MVQRLDGQSMRSVAPDVAPDLGGITAFGGSTSHQTPRQVNGIVTCDALAERGRVASMGRSPASKAHPISAIPVVRASREGWKLSIRVSRREFDKREAAYLGVTAEVRRRTTRFREPRGTASAGFAAKQSILSAVDTNALQRMPKCAR